MKNVAIVLGTRPEIIKLAPVIFRLRASKRLAPIVISTGQHREMASQVFSAFGLKPDIELALMEQNQTPLGFLSRALASLEQTLVHPTTPYCGVIVQGDTTTALAGALSAFHLGLPLAHVEAGLRTYRLDSPFPEEMNRTVISRLGDLHFAPTTLAGKQLSEEKVSGEVFVVGNTVVDALQWMNQRLSANGCELDLQLNPLALERKRYVLVTGHRRENFDLPLRNLCDVLLQLVETIPDLHIVYPFHLNPNISNVVQARLGGQAKIHLLRPVNYATTLYLLKNASLVISDSGGIQEEAPSFRKFVLVTRNTTERPEAIAAGFAKLSPLDQPDALFQAAQDYLTRSQAAPGGPNPFGDGTAAEKIGSALENRWG